MMPDDSQNPTRDQQTPTATAFVEIVDILVNDFDVIDVLTQLTRRCVDLLHAKAAGILLADTNGHLCVVGASSEQIHVLELFQLQNDEGPCLDCYTSGAIVAAPDLTTQSVWPMFAAESVAAGYCSVYAIPLHHNDTTLGCLNLFMTSTGLLAPADIALAQALADVASIAVVQSHANQQPDGRAGRLDHALDSRIVIEQAKGMIAEQLTLDMHEAFKALRAHVHANNLSLTATARRLVTGTLAIVASDPPPTTAELGELGVVTTVEGGRRIVRIAGELDLASRLACLNACVDGESDTVEIDRAGITFMDCSGYSALTDARLALQQRNVTLTVSTPRDNPLDYSDSSHTTTESRPD